MLMVRLKLLQAVENLSRLSCMLCSLVAFRVQSSANMKSLITVCLTWITAFRWHWLCSFPCVWYMMQIPSSKWWNASCNNTENIKQNNIGARTQLCFTPFVTAKASDMSPLSWTQALIPSWNCCTMEINFSGHPYFASIFHNPSLLTVSRAFVRSAKVVYRLHLCSWHFSCSCLTVKIIPQYLALLRSCIDFLDEDPFLGAL